MCRILLTPVLWISCLAALLSICSGSGYAGTASHLETALTETRDSLKSGRPVRLGSALAVMRAALANKNRPVAAVLDFASRYRETLLYNIYQMGRNSIERGSRDNWTLHPKRMESLMAAVEADTSIRKGPDLPGALAGYISAGIPIEYFEQLHKPEDRDPRGYILPADQPDFPTATKFVNTLIKNGVTVHRATSDFDVGGTQYPLGSYVVKTAQAFRPHVMDMFEPQAHPDNFEYEGAPPTPPYDNAGWTLVFQMGVEFDRILEGFDGPFERIEGLAVPPLGRVRGANNAVGYLLSHQVNDAATATNRLLEAGQEVYWLEQPVTANGVDYPAGTLFVPAQGSAAETVQQVASI